MTARGTLVRSFGVGLGAVTLAVLAGCPAMTTDGGMTGTGGAGTNGAAASVTLRFDNGGAESGVTVPGATSFSISGSNWSGGAVRTQGIPPLYASGAFAYEVSGGPASVTFDSPPDSIRFFFVHGGNIGAGTATAFDAGGNALGSASSSAATVFGGSSGNFVTLDFAAPIARIEFSGGIIDDFSF